MAITLEKTWQFDINQDAFMGASSQETHENCMLALKNSLIGFAQNPWTVISSCDASTASNDGTDHWSNAQDDVNWATAAHSWIVLQQAGINPKFQICIDLDDSLYSDIIVVISPEEGFGDANGGTDGTTTARPIATDEHIINSGLDWMYGDATNRNTAMHVMQTTDGECTRIAWLYNNVVANIAFFDKAKNPHSHWHEGVIYSWADGNYNETVTLTAYLAANTRVHSTVSGTTTNFYLATVYGYNSTMPAIMDATNDLDGSYEVYPIFLFSNTANSRGTQGALYDFWWATETGPTTGDTYDNKKAVQFGKFVWPWDGSSVPITSY